MRLHTWIFWFVVGTLLFFWGLEWALHYQGSELGRRIAESLQRAIDNWGK